MTSMYLPDNCLLTDFSDNDMPKYAVIYGQVPVKILSSDVMIRQPGK